VPVPLVAIFHGHLRSIFMSCMYHVLWRRRSSITCKIRLCWGSRRASVSCMYHVLWRRRSSITCEIRLCWESTKCKIDMTSAQVFSPRWKYQNIFILPCSTDKMTTSSQHADKDLDLTQASRGVWLVKVPKYVANKWEKVPGNIEAGKLKIVRYFIYI
jgi:Transcription initiation factor IIF, small subunit (RAP30)